MNMHAPPIPPDLWLRQVFSSQSAREGGVVRRKVRDVEMILGRAALEAAVHRRGWHMIENAGQFVIFCNQDPIRLVV
jgi:hypothetical protein